MPKSIRELIAELNTIYAKPYWTAEERTIFVKNFPSLRRAALKGEAGERVVEAVKESRDIIGSSWKLAEAMSAYRSAVGEE